MGTIELESVPYNIQFDGNGNLWALTSGDEKIQCFSLNTVTGTWGPVSLTSEAGTAWSATSTALKGIDYIHLYYDGKVSEELLVSDADGALKQHKVKHKRFKKEETAAETK